MGCGRCRESAGARRPEGPGPKAESLGELGCKKICLADSASRLSQTFLERCVQPRPDVHRQSNGLGVAENLDRLSRCVHNQTAVMAVPEVPLEFFPCGRVQISVEIVGKLADYVATVQFGAPLRVLLNLSRNFKRPRNSRDFTAASESPSKSAVSSVERSSISRSTNTKR